MDESWAEIRAIWKQNQWLYVAAGFLLGVLFQPFLQYVRSDLNGFLQNLVPEVVGILITVLIIDRIYRWREKIAWKKTLIYDMGSRVRDVALHAAEQLQQEKWLYDGSLKGAYLHSANLQEADLSYANLRNVRMDWADLREVNLTEAKLESSNLGGSDFRRLSDDASRAATLWYAKLNNATLGTAKLDDVNFGGADLTNVDLQESNAYLARFDNNTTLPDGSKWTPETDMRRFTDPEHPQFWRSDDPSSPGYRGK